MGGSANFSVPLFLAQLFFSGLVAATISFLLNRNDERRRTARDHLTKLFDAAREDIAAAMEAGVTYYTGTYAPVAKGKSPPDNVRLLEARVLLAERNVRAALSLLKKISIEEGGGRLDSITPLEENLVIALTESFGEADPANAQNARRVVLSGAPLRQRLAELRQEQLAARWFGRKRSLLLLAFLFIALTSHAAGLFGWLIFHG